MAFFILLCLGTILAMNIVEFGFKLTKKHLWRGGLVYLPTRKLRSAARGDGWKSNMAAISLLPAALIDTVIMPLMVSYGLIAGSTLKSVDLIGRLGRWIISKFPESSRSMLCRTLEEVIAQQEQMNIRLAQAGRNDLHQVLNDLKELYWFFTNIVKRLRKIEANHDLAIEKIDDLKVTQSNPNRIRVKDLSVGDTFWWEGRTNCIYIVESRCPAGAIDELARVRCLTNNDNQTKFIGHHWVVRLSSA